MSFSNILISFAALLLSTIGGIHTAPVQTISDAQMYLTKFGYLPENSGLLRITSENTMIQAIQDFQEFAGLEVNGQLDGRTLEYMSMSRCGVKDKNPNSRLKRSNGWGIPWNKKDLTYKITQFPRTMHPTNVYAEIAKAFNVWTEYTDLTFQLKMNGPVDIEIKFVQGNHGDGEEISFDGPSGTLAHAFHPPIGDAHFDDAEYWTLNTFEGTNLFQVAAHEFGHALGLHHSSTKEALMFAIYQGFEPYFRLHSDDITRIQQLYGKKTTQQGEGSSHPPDQSDVVFTYGQCMTPNSELGVCIQLEQCTYLYNLLQKKSLLDADRNFLQRSQCGPSNGKVSVCCRRG